MARYDTFRLFHVLLIGDDLIPDIAISRMPANSLQEAEQMVQKVINYETQRKDTLQEWQKNLLFVADDADAGGDFVKRTPKLALGYRTSTIKHIFA